MKKLKFNYFLKYYNMVLKYRDVIRMTLFGRHDKNINDTTSIYQGYDRYAITTTGGGVNSFSVSNNGTVGFGTTPNAYISNATNINVAPLTTTLTTNMATAPVYSLTITTPSTGFTANPTLFFYGGGAPTTIATATCTQAGGSINTVTLTNAGVGYSSAPIIGWNGGGLINITGNVTTNLLTSFTITAGGSFITSPTIIITGGGGITQTTTCTLNAGIINAIALPANTNYTTAPTIYVYDGGAMKITPNMYYPVNSIQLTYTAGTFQTQPTISYNGGGVINITPTMNGGNTIVTGFTITNGGYTNCCIFTPYYCFKWNRICNMHKHIDKWSYYSY